MRPLARLVTFVSLSFSICTDICLRSIFYSFCSRFTRIVPNVVLFVQLSSLSNRRGCGCERKNKQANAKDSRFRVSISERPSDLLGQRTHTPTHA